MYSFPLSEQERVLKKDHANLYCDGEAFAGAFYLTNERLVFVGYLFDIHDKYVEEVPLAHVANIKPGKTFYIVPNVVHIETIRERKLKVIVTKRNQWIDAINEQIQKIT